MPLYEYRCPQCGTTVPSARRGDRLQQICRGCGNTPLHRVFGFSAPAMVQEHYNNTLGRNVSGMRDFKEGLKIASDQATAETGIEHNYKPLEWGDHKAFGATAEGIHESNVVRSKMKMPLLPEIK